MDSSAVKRAALETLRRAILKRFPPGRERECWLMWADGIEQGAGPATAWTYAVRTEQGPSHPHRPH